jgi:hypothetical protein
MPFNTASLSRRNTGDRSPSRSIHPVTRPDLGEIRAIRSDCHTFARISSLTHSSSLRVPAYRRPDGADTRSSLDTSVPFLVAAAARTRRRALTTRHLSRPLPPPLQEVWCSYQPRAGRHAAPGNHRDRRWNNEVLTSARKQVEHSFLPVHTVPSVLRSAARPRRYVPDQHKARAVVRAVALRAESPRRRQ